MTRKIYLDYAAATPMDPEVEKAMHPYWQTIFYNPSASYLAARQVRQNLGQARAKIAMWLSARPLEIYFTAGATEANNLAVQGVMREFPNGELLVSAIEHDSVLAPAGLFNGKEIPVTPQGIVDVKALEKLITSKTILVSAMMVNNELGTVQPIKEIASLLKKVRQQRIETKNNTPIYFHTDAAQAGNLFDLHTHRLGVDLMSLNGGKVYGPKQSGVLFIKAGLKIKPLIVGGGQEGDLRSGTENVAGAIGLSKALDMAQKRHTKEFKRLGELRNSFILKLAATVPSVMINGSNKRQSPHLLSLTFPGTDNERLMMELDEAGIQTAVGSACSASNEVPSHVLSAIGLSDELVRSTLRFSFGRQTTEEELTQTIDQIQRLTSIRR